MIQLRKSDDRGRTKLDWLDGRHTFSFGEYYDPAMMGFSKLRVINEDWIAPGGGFGTHPHRDMEIITWILEGALRHRDSMGNGPVIRAGDMQRMTAGTGITHSEINDSATQPVHMLQIWILPSQTGLTPGYEQQTFPAERRRGADRLVVSPDGRDNSLMIHQNARIHIAQVEPGTPLTHEVPPGRRTWIQAARGPVEINGLRLESGDGAGAIDERRLVISSPGESDVLLFDLP
ncbi:MAG TPA: pirin family protein [Candidatus Binataceae bacterium]|nr:pirin family protein [Candidatus Binataceae bacterium]